MMNNNKETIGDASNGGKANGGGSCLGEKKVQFRFGNMICFLCFHLYFYPFVVSVFVQSRRRPSSKKFSLNLEMFCWKNVSQNICFTCI